jgi:thioredoxin 1
MTEFNRQNFEEAVQKNEVVVVDFWAPWCGPCRMLAPTMEEVANETAKEGKIAIGKINVDEEGALAAAFGIRSIPSVVFIKNGQVKDIAVGVYPKDFYIQKIKELTGN